MFIKHIKWFYGLTAIMVLCFATNSLDAQSPGSIDLPGVDQLPVIKQLPNPFVMNDGTMVRSASDWTKRRAEIKAMMLYYQYGHMPPAPNNLVSKELSSISVLDGAATEKRILLTMGPGNKVEINIGIIIPEGPGPFPAIIKFTPHMADAGLRDIPIARELIDRGYIVCEYARDSVDPDVEGNDVIGTAQAAYPDYDWATLAAWAWGCHRVVDYFMTLDYVDKEHIAITGHSRDGKAALLAGALDERIALTVPNGSGCGGGGCYRVKVGESLKLITEPKRFSYWFHPRLRDFADKETRLPFDQHFLKALVAPRALLTTDALGDKWANPIGEQQTYLAAQPVFDFLNASGNNAIHFRQGGHDQTKEDWNALADFADKVFFDKTSSRSFNKLPFNDAKLFSWTAPK
jgi:(4-O-methyl)-D-glucuronate---lignin esterase